MKQLTAICIGAGGRGRAYSNIMSEMPEKFKLIGVAEPVDAAREIMRESFNLPAENCYKTWEEILSRPKFADIAIIATMDDMHYGPAMKAISLGYDILLEKPIAQTVEECSDIAKAAHEKGVRVIVCHVLRYTPFYKKVKEIVDRGDIGDIMSVIALERIGNIHFSHSYVRGNWHSEEETTPMLLAKSCHDLDIIQWIIGKTCKKVSSFGDLTYFKSENAPKGAPVRCADGTCPIADTCPYNCIKLYHDDKNNLWFRRAATKGISQTTYPTDEEVMKALMTTDYGLCVFHANNDVLDHQTVDMLFDGNVTASFTVNAFNGGGRAIHLFGTKGELVAEANDTEIRVYNSDIRKWSSVPVKETEESILGGHGGGDQGIIADLYDYLCGTYNGCSVADISVSAANHLIGFAAERARHTVAVVDVDKYYAEFGLENNIK